MSVVIGKNLFRTIAMTPIGPVLLHQGGLHQSDVVQAVSYGNSIHSRSASLVRCGRRSIVPADVRRFASTTFFGWYKSRIMRLGGPESRLATPRWFRRSVGEGFNVIDMSDKWVTFLPGIAPPSRVEIVADAIVAPACDRPRVRASVVRHCLRLSRKRRRRCDPLVAAPAEALALTLGGETARKDTERQDIDSRAGTDVMSGSFRRIDAELRKKG